MKTAIVDTDQRRRELSFISSQVIFWLSWALGNKWSQLPFFHNSYDLCRAGFSRTLFSSFPRSDFIICPPSPAGWALLWPRETPDPCQGRVRGSAGSSLKGGVLPCLSTAKRKASLGGRESNPAPPHSFTLASSQGLKPRGELRPGQCVAPGQMLSLAASSGWIPHCCPGFLGAERSKIQWRIDGLLAKLQVSKLWPVRQIQPSVYFCK